jgi:hypothetical protein
MNESSIPWATTMLGRIKIVLTKIVDKINNRGLKEKFRKRSIK